MRGWGWAVVAAALALAACERSPAQVAADAKAASDASAAAESAAEAASAAATAAAAASSERRFTKVEFDNYAYNRTKAQIRAQFGPPLVVHDESDTWFYSSIQVFDPEAGTQAGVNIQFAGMPGSDDFVVSVSYQ
jgi:hypothetical protein